MRKINNKKVIYYNSYKDDVVINKNQNFKISNDYKWMYSNIIYNFFSTLLYYFVYIISFFYCKIYLHVKIENRQVLKKYKKQGYFLYGNHTQIIGDAFIPAHVAKGKRVYVIVSQANLGIKGIGKILPMLGAIPKTDSIKNLKKMFDTVCNKINTNNCIVIYPEAHVWPYYTKIRPLENTAFKFQIFCDVPSFVMTTTYYKRKFCKKPGIKIYIDGPFIPDKNISKKEKHEKLSKEIYECMKNRSKNSTYEYIKYIKEKK